MQETMDRLMFHHDDETGAFTHVSKIAKEMVVKLPNSDQLYNVDTTYPLKVNGVFYNVDNIGSANVLMRSPDAVCWDAYDIRVHETLTNAHSIRMTTFNNKYIAVYYRASRETSVNTIEIGTSLDDLKIIGEVEFFGSMRMSGSHDPNIIYVHDPFTVYRIELDKMFRSVEMGFGDAFSEENKVIGFNRNTKVRTIIPAKHDDYMVLGDGRVRRIVKNTLHKREHDWLTTGSDGDRKSFSLVNMDTYEEFNEHGFSFAAAHNTFCVKTVMISNNGIYYRPYHVNIEFHTERIYSVYTSGYTVFVDTPDAVYIIGYIDPVTYLLETPAEKKKCIYVYEDDEE